MGRGKQFPRLPHPKGRNGMEREEWEDFHAMQTEWEDAQSDIPFGMSFLEWVDAQESIDIQWLDSEGSK